MADSEIPGTSPVPEPPFMPRTTPVPPEIPRRFSSNQTSNGTSRQDNSSSSNSSPLATGAPFIPPVSTSIAAFNPFPSSSPGPSAVNSPNTPLTPATPTPATFAKMSSKSPSPKPSKPPKFKLPKLRLHLDEISHPSTHAFLSAVTPSTLVPSLLQRVLFHLYASPLSHTTHVPSVRSITLILRPMSGVAHTSGIHLDPAHKEIHFSLNYLSTIAANAPARLGQEIQGVVAHELVHCVQYDGKEISEGKGKAPGGLIEGIADWVRLQMDLGPPHWKKSAKGKWDDGYDKTAYFLQYVEERYGEGMMRKLNEKLRTQPYEEKAFWTELVGRPVEQLWGDYCRGLEREGEMARLICGGGKSKENGEGGKGKGEENVKPGRENGAGEEGSTGTEEEDQGVLVERDDVAGHPVKRGTFGLDKSVSTKVSDRLHPASPEEAGV